jgi:hypothetical protein
LPLRRLLPQIAQNCGLGSPATLWSRGFCVCRISPSTFGRRLVERWRRRNAFKQLTLNAGDLAWVDVYACLCLDCISNALRICMFTQVCQRFGDRPGPARNSWWRFLWWDGRHRDLRRRDAGLICRPRRPRRLRLDVGGWHDESPFSARPAAWPGHMAACERAQCTLDSLQRSATAVPAAN